MPRMSRPRARLAFILTVSLGSAVAALSSCGALVRPSDDGGLPGTGGTTGGGTGGTTGGGTGGTTGGGTGGTTGGGTGGATGGGTGGATGGGAGGGPGSGVSVATLSILQPGVSPIVGLSGSEGDLWALDSGGLLFHSTGGAFSRVTQVGGLAAGLYAVSGAVFAVTADTLRACTSSCASGGTFATFTLGSFEHGYGVCGLSSTDVYATVSDGSSKTELYHFNGSLWSKVGAGLALDAPHGCSEPSAGVVYIAGRDGVLRYDNGAGSFEAIGSSGITFEAVLAIGSEIQAVGGRYRVGRRETNGTWTVLDDPLAADDLHALHGASAGLLFKAGGKNVTARSNWGYWNGAAWQEAGSHLSALDTVRAALAVPSNRVYFGGWNNSGGAAIVRVSW